ncbi:MAG TPA: hypothetical protein VGB39_05970 [Sphingomicrobium sp.]|jgi:hypothetical protein
MRAGWRFGIAAIVAASIFGSAPALALVQAAAPPATNTANPPAPAETVGPRELRDFSINGTVTRPATPPPERAAQPPATTPRTTSPSQPATTAPARDRASPAPTRPSPGPASAAPQPSSADPLAPFAVDGPAPTDVQTAQPDLEQAPLAPPSAPSQDEPTNYIPWILVVLLIGAAAAFYWRQRSQPSYATASAGAYAMPERAPEPAPPRPVPRPQPLQRDPSPRPEHNVRPAPAAEAATPRPAAAAPTPAALAPRPAQPAAPFGMVTTSLRPWLDIEFTPGRCVVENDKATIQFDVTLFNSGGAPARDVLIEASMFNAGPAQDQEIGAFFQHPETKGDRIPTIPPLKRVALKSAVSLTREQLRQFEVAGRKLFVPLVGVNALYRWSGGEGQTSASYLVGRDTQSEKMAPLRLDLGPRIFRGLGARRNDASVRN